MAARVGWLAKVQRLIERNHDPGPYDLALLLSTQRKHAAVTAFLSKIAREQPARELTADSVEAMLRHRFLMRVERDRIIYVVKAAPVSALATPALLKMPWGAILDRLYKQGSDADVKALAERVSRLSAAEGGSVYTHARDLPQRPPFIQKLCRRLEERMSASQATAAALGMRIFSDWSSNVCAQGCDRSRCYGATLATLAKLGADLNQVAQVALQQRDTLMFRNRYCTIFVSTLLDGCKAETRRAIVTQRQQFQGEHFCNLSSVAVAYSPDKRETLRALVRAGADLGDCNANCDGVWGAVALALRDDPRIRALTALNEIGVAMDAAVLDEEDVALAAWQRIVAARALLDTKRPQDEIDVAELHNLLSSFQWGERRAYIWKSVMRWRRKSALQSLFLAESFPSATAHPIPSRSARFWDCVALALEGGSSLHERLLIPVRLNSGGVGRGGFRAFRHCSVHQLLSWRAALPRSGASLARRALIDNAATLLERLEPLQGSNVRRLCASLEAVGVTVSMSFPTLAALLGVRGIALMVAEFVLGPRSPQQQQQEQQHTAASEHKSSGLGLV